MQLFHVVTAAVCLSHVCLAQPGDDSEFYDIFENDFPEWRLAFRGTPGVMTSVYSAYTTRQTIQVEPGCKQFSNTSQPCSHHYRNNAVFDNWADVDQIVFAVYKGGKMVAHVKFAASHSTTVDWFSMKNIVSSTWTDIKNGGSNIFSIDGHNSPSVNRHFFMEHSYGGCPGDLGWFVAVDMARPTCDWEKKRVPHTFPAFLYSSTDKMVNWNTASVGVADCFGVFVKYRQGQAIGK